MPSVIPALVFIRLVDRLEERSSLAGTEMVFDEDVMARIREAEGIGDFLLSE